MLQGNEKMKHGKVFLDNAIKFYTDALEQKYDDDKLRASLYANRAQANLVKGITLVILFVVHITESLITHKYQYEDFFYYYFKMNTYIIFLSPRKLWTCH